MSHRKRIVVSVLRIGAIGIVLLFVARYVYSHWQEVKVYQWSVNPVALILSLISLLAAFFYAAWTWMVALRFIGVRLKYRQAFQIYVVPHLGKYLPGKAWAVAGMAFLAYREGIPASTAAGMAILNQGVAIAGGITVGLVGIIIYGIQLPWQLPLWMVFSGLFGLLWLIHPKILGVTANVMGRILHREEIKFSLRWYYAYIMLALKMVSWTLFGFAFYLFVYALTGIIKHLLVTVSAFPLACCIGILALFVPAGIGVREAVLMTTLINVGVNEGAAIGISLASRIWYTAVELFVIFVACLLSGFRLLNFRFTKKLK